MFVYVFVTVYVSMFVSESVVFRVRAGLTLEYRAAEATRGQERTSRVPCHDTEYR
jgi:hypothetical protein